MLHIDYLSELSKKSAKNAHAKSFVLKGKNFSPYPETSLMGVVNLSPESWYRESVCLTQEAAVRRGRVLSAQGAAIIDIGAESTLLESARVAIEKQKELLLPVISKLTAENILCSVETYHLSVAEACLQAGAAVLNLTAAKETTPYYEQVAEHEAGVVICYIQNAKNVREAGDFLLTENHTELLMKYFEGEIKKAEKAGVTRLWLDPGLGFYYQNLQDSKQRIAYKMKTLLASFELKKLGYPICHALPHAFENFEDSVRYAEPFFAVLASLGQTDLLRTHEVAPVQAVLRTMEGF